jgi:hypothetical protein
MSKTLKATLPAVLAVATTLASAYSYAQGQGKGQPPGPDVTIVGPLPLPVTGTVSGAVTITNQPNVFVTNTAANPVPVRTISSRVPFAKLLCVGGGPDCATTVGTATSPPLPQSFTVPAATASGQAVSQLVFNFVSGNCVGTARTTAVFLAGQPTTLQVADTGDNFTSNKIPMFEAQFIGAPGLNGVQAFATPTQIEYAPGTVISVTFDLAQAGSMRCVVQLNGYFVTG